MKYFDEVLNVLICACITSSKPFLSKVKENFESLFDKSNSALLSLQQNIPRGFETPSSLSLLLQ